MYIFSILHSIFHCNCSIEKEILTNDFFVSIGTGGLSECRNFLILGGGDQALRF